jgi:hypothetical protein
LTFQSDREGQRKDKAASGAAKKRTVKRPPASEIGSALRSVYDRALAEDIPPEMLDLLGKLG